MWKKDVELADYIENGYAHTHTHTQSSVYNMRHAFNSCVWIKLENIDYFSSSSIVFIAMRMHACTAYIILSMHIFTNWYVLQTRFVATLFNSIRNDHKIFVQLICWMNSWLAGLDSIKENSKHNEKKRRSHTNIHTKHQPTT